MQTLQLHNLMPIGSIMPSMLNETEMSGFTSVDWVLCDGRSVTGSTYSEISGESNIPDLRGMFLRGKNNGRNDGLEDSEGERELGSTQGYSTARPSNNFTTNTTGNHNHDFGNETEIGSGGKYRVTSYAGSNDIATSYSGNHSHTVNGGGDNETAPNNSSINYYIKINQSNIQINS